MSFADLWNRLRRGRRPWAPRPSFAPRLDVLEDRTLPSTVSFGPPAVYGVGAQPTGVAVGDFNGDGKPDLVTSNQGGNSVSVLLGDGAGGFQAARDFGVRFAPRSVAVGDFNGDGKLDAVAACSNAVGVLLGNGDGTLQTARNFAAGNLPVSVAVGDFNADGKLDAAVADENFSGAAAVLLGNGDGTFQAPRSFAAGFFPYFLTVGDFDGDGKPDLAVANLGAFGVNTVSVFLNDGGGSFRPARNAAVGPEPVWAAAGDFNGDGLSDLAAGNAGDGTVSVLLSNGDGSFRNAPTLAVGNYPFAGAAGDFDGDGTADLAVAGTSSGVGVLLGDGDGSFQPARYFSPSGGDAVAVGDFNGDGKPDLAVAMGGINGSVDVLQNRATTATTVSGPAEATYGQTVTLTAAVAGDAGPVTGGSVTFLDGDTPLTPALPLDGAGRAHFSIATLGAGSHAITASYSGTPGGAGVAGFGARVGGRGV